jgi:glycosyltransferase involved in cell wall biosynthesis
MNIGILVPGFNSDEQDWAIPIQTNLVRELARHDDVRVIALRYPHRRDRYSIYGAEVYSLGYGAWTRGVRRLRLWADALRLLERLHRDKPFDVLHSMWADETGFVAGMFGRLRNVPVITSILGGELAALWEIGYGAQLSAYGRWITGQALNYADRVHIISRYVGKLLGKSPYNVAEAKLIYIPLGIDDELFTPSLDVQHEPNRLLCVASLIPVKDHGMLLRAVAQLENVTLDLIGEGAEEANLKTLAEDLGVASRVRFVGTVSHTDLHAHYRHVVLHVLSSRHETFAMCIAEAAACGTPSVATRVGMLPDYPSIGVTVAVGDHDSLAREIRALLADEERLAAMRISARETVEKELTIRKTAERLRDVYAGMGNRKPHPEKPLI